VTLRRRILLGGRERGSANRQLVALQALGLSKLADESLVVRIKPHAPLPAPAVAHWVPDASSDVCAATGARFALFNRRHHCRVCGNIFVDAACDSLACVPDLGHYSPVRVCDGCVGVESVAGCEDMVLLAARRTELVCVLQAAVAKLTGADLAIQFSNSSKLDCASCPPSASQSPAAEVALTDAAKTAAFAPGFSVSVTVNGSKLVLAGQPGLPHEVVDEKQRRQQARRKKASERRRQEEAERAERAAVREAAREQDRVARLAEKKARRAAEKEEARRQAESDSAGAGGGVGGAGGGAKRPAPKFGKGGGDEAPAAKGTGGAASELAAKLAARRASAGGN